MDEKLRGEKSNETFSAVLSQFFVHSSFEFADEILWYYHLNKTFSAVLSQRRFIRRSEYGGRNPVM